jgi:acyl-CoA synthetase (NDP forming)
MLKKEVANILSSSKAIGWILEPEAKRLLFLSGIDTPRFIWAKKAEEAITFAEEIGFPVVAKVISQKVLHKSEKNGVVVDIGHREQLVEAFNHLSQIEGFDGMMVEKMVFGIELIVGAKIDYQFGPVILLGMGGTGVEIYRDVALRMAPLAQKDIESMMKCLKAYPLLKGYRGSQPISIKELSRLMATFSELVMDLEAFIESIDLNPIICSSTRCVVADARIILRGEKG